MPKTYKKKYYGRARDKYSVEQSAGLVATENDGTGAVTVVPAASIQGMRKVKHLTVSMANPAASVGGGASILYYALVYVPAGTTPGALSASDGPMYEPNQYVMCCGVFDFDAGPLRIHCPTARNLNSGDSVSLLILNPTGSYGYRYVVRYAITLQ